MSDGPDREGWLKKKPSSHAAKPWKTSPIQQRFFVSEGAVVKYYEKAPKKAGAKPKATFDLRSVSTLRPAAASDPTAPKSAVELVVTGHHLTIDFGYRGELLAWLRFWANQVPASAVDPTWEEFKEVKDDALAAELAAKSAKEPIHSTRGSIDAPPSGVAAPLVTPDAAPAAAPAEAAPAPEPAPAAERPRGASEPAPLSSWAVGSGGAKLTVSRGSVVHFRGTAIVNAANEGCVGGGGVDGAVNDAGGPALVAARRALPIIEAMNGVRCPCGDARTTVAGALPVEFVIHAVGPNYRMYTQKEGKDGAPPKDEYMADGLLHSAYVAAMREAAAKGMSTVAFSLLSSGIFRGGRDLSAVLRIALLAVGAHAYDGLEEVSFIAFTQQEADALLAEAEALFGGGGLASPSALAAMWASMRRTEPAPTPPAAPVAAPPPPAPAPTPAAVEMSGVRGDGYAPLVDEEEGGGGAAAALTFPEPPTSPPAHLAATSARAGSGAPAAADGPTGAFPPPPKPSLGPAPDGAKAGLVAVLAVGCVLALAAIFLYTLPPVVEAGSGEASSGAATE